MLWVHAEEMMVVYIICYCYYLRNAGEGNGNPLQYPCLENLMDRGA